MSEQFTGVCRGGPYDGRQQVYFRSIMEVALGPEFDFLDVSKEPFEVEVKAGTYHFTDGAWLWQTSNKP